MSGSCKVYNKLGLPTFWDKSREDSVRVIEEIRRLLALNMSPADVVEKLVFVEV